MKTFLDIKHCDRGVQFGCAYIKTEGNHMQYFSLILYFLTFIIALNEELVMFYFWHFVFRPISIPLLVRFGAFRPVDD